MDLLRFFWVSGSGSGKFELTSGLFNMGQNTGVQLLISALRACCRYLHVSDKSDSELYKSRRV